jgi:hypothetical protein
MSAPESINLTVIKNLVPGNCMVTAIADNLCCIFNSEMN